MAVRLQEGALFLPPIFVCVPRARNLENVANEKTTHHVRLSAHIAVRQGLRVNASLSLHD